MFPIRQLRTKRSASAESLMKQTYGCNNEDVPDKTWAIAICELLAEMMMTFLTVLTNIHRIHHGMNNDTPPWDE